MQTNLQDARRKPSTVNSTGSNIEQLFERFEKLYGTRFTDMWSNDPAGVKRAWTDALAGYSVGEVKAGLAACRTKPWPPTLPEFLLLCRPAPDFERTFVEAQEQVSKRQFGEDKWSNKAIYWTAVEFGFHDLRAMSWTQAKNRWSRIYVEKLAKEESLPEVPLPRQVLPAPGKGETDAETAKRRLADIKNFLGRRHG